MCRAQMPGRRLRDETQHLGGVLAVAWRCPAAAQEQATVVKRDGSRVSGRFEAWNRNTNTLYIRVSLGDQQIIPLGEAAVIDVEGNGTRTCRRPRLGPASGGDHVLMLRTGDVIRGRLTNIEGGEGSGEENQPRMRHLQAERRRRAAGAAFKDVRRIYLGNFPAALSESPAAAPSRLRSSPSRRRARPAPGSANARPTFAGWPPT